MRKLAFLGSKRSGLRALQTLLEAVPSGTVKAIVCPDDEADARSVVDGFREIAAHYRIDFHERARKSTTMALLREIAADIVLVHGWYQIIPVDELPQTLFLGFHYSPLPRFRGNAPLVWQIVSGCREIGVSFFQLTAGMDDGPLVDQRMAPLGRDETVADALEKADDLVADMVRGLASALRHGGPTLHPQPDVRPSYCGLRTAADGEIDWRWNATRIHDFIRAQTRPYPGAFTSMPDGTRLILWSSQVEPDDYLGVPGSVVAIRADHVVVAAGEGAVRLFSIKSGEGPDQPASEVLRSLRMRLD